MLLPRKKNQVFLAALMASTQQKVAAILLFVGFISAIIALAVPDWSHFSAGGTVKVGLWQVCGGGTCNNIDCSVGIGCPSWFKAARAFAVLAFIFSFLAMVAGFAHSFAGKGGAAPILVLAVIAGLCSLIAWGTWVDKANKELLGGVPGVAYGAGVAFSIICWMVEWVGAAIAFKAGGQAAASG